MSWKVCVDFALKYLSLLLSKPWKIAKNIFTKISFSNEPSFTPIEKEFIQKRMQRSSLLSAGKNCFNSLPLQLFCITLLEKQSKFPRYNMKCRGKPVPTWNIPRSITFSPLHFMLYRGKSIIFGTVYHALCKNKYYVKSTQQAISLL